jgi:hypothetical protein
MNIAGVFANQERLKRTQNRREAGSEKTLAQASQSFIGFNANECPIEVAFNYRGL